MVAATAMLREMWAGMLRGRTGEYVARWRNKLLDEQAGITEPDEPKKPTSNHRRAHLGRRAAAALEDSSEGEEYTCALEPEIEEVQLPKKAAKALKAVKKQYKDLGENQA